MSADGVIEEGGDESEKNSDLLVRCDGDSLKFLEDFDLFRSIGVLENGV